MKVTPETRALTLLAHINSYWSAGGINCGRSRESTLLDVAIKLLGGYGAVDITDLENGEQENLDEARDWLTDQILKKEGFITQDQIDSHNKKEESHVENDNSLPAIDWNEFDEDFNKKYTEKGIKHADAFMDLIDEALKQ